jgi:hypothetical protein
MDQEDRGAQNTQSATDYNRDDRQKRYCFRYLQVQCGAHIRLNDLGFGPKDTRDIVDRPFN